MSFVILGGVTLALIFVRDSLALRVYSFLIDSIGFH